MMIWILFSFIQISLISIIYFKNAIFFKSKSHLFNFANMRYWRKFFKINRTCSSCLFWFNENIRISFTYCEGVYRGFVLVCKKFDIEEYWDLAHFRKHTQLNATKEIEKFAWNAIYLIAATESFFFDHLII